MKYDYPGNLGYKIRQEKLKLVSVAKSSVLAKNIVKRSLMPVLDALEEIYQNALHKIGRRWAEELRSEVISFSPSGRRYRIIEVNFRAAKAKRGQKSRRYQQTGEWVASAPGEPPARLTESLLNSLSYRVNDSTLLIGQLIGVSGDEDLMGTEIRPLFFRPWNMQDMREGYAGRLFVSKRARQVPVREYSSYLEGTEGAPGIRPWFAEKMIQMRDEIKDELKEEIWNSIRKKTRSKQIDKALIIKIYMTKA
jgi:hypothetical protein